MNKVEKKKQNKLEALLASAYELFTTNGISETSVSDITGAAGMAKGTFYLYFKDKYELRNRLVAVKSRPLFAGVLEVLNTLDPDRLSEAVVAVVDKIIAVLRDNLPLLRFLAKNMTWSVYQETLRTYLTGEELDLRKAFYERMQDVHKRYRNADTMIFLITELVSGCCYNTLLFEQPAPIDQIKPDLYSAVTAIVAAHQLPEVSQ